LLGFWWQDTSSAWYRIGGHWVTVAGVDYIHGLLKISDPDLDMAEQGWPGYVCGNGIYYSHVPLPHLEDDTLHNDAGNVSHDVYPVMESITPCGVLMFDTTEFYGYPWEELNLEKYLGHNLNPQCQYPIPGSVPPPPIFVEIEAAKIICPEQPFRCDTIWTYSKSKDVRTGMTKCNYGREGAADQNGFWWDPWSGNYNDTTALFSGSVVLGNDPSNLAFFGRSDPPGEFWPYIPMIYDIYEAPESVTVPSTAVKETLNINDLYTRYFHNFPRGSGLTMDIEQIAIGFDDPYYQAHNNIFQIFHITNTGDTTIPDLKFAIFMDWDLMPDRHFDLTGADKDLNLGWTYNTEDPDSVPFGTMIVPAFDIYAERFLGADNPTYIWPNNGWGWNRDTLYNVMFGVDHNKFETGLGPNDMTPIITTNAFSLAPEDTQTIVTLTGPAYFYTLCDALKFTGYYRGDINGDGEASEADAIYLFNYIFKSGALPMPFVDQGDVDADGDMDNSDVIRIVKTRFGITYQGDPPFIWSNVRDYPRFPDEIPFPEDSSMFSKIGYKDLCR